MGKHLTPFDVVERLIGKPEKVGEIVSVDPKAPYHWRKEAGLRAAGDLPYAVHMRSLLAHSTAHNLGLTADHLIWGAPVAEIEAILAERDAPAPAFTSRRASASRSVAA
jgi:hypothetical protein